MQHRRSIFLINKPFQLRFSIYVCSWMFALSLIYPLIIWNLFDFFLRYSTNNPALESLKSTRNEMIWLLVLLQLIFLAVTLLISIFVSHRIAGPLYKLNRFLREGTDHELRDALTFRKADHFKELAESYNSFRAAVRTLLERRAEKIRRTSERLEKALPSCSEPVRRELEAILSDLRKE